MTLTPRQRDVVQLCAEGLSYAQIARHLGIEVRTVRYHVDTVALQLPGDGPPLRRVLLALPALLAA